MSETEFVASVEASIASSGGRCQWCGAPTTATLTAWGKHYELLCSWCRLEHADALLKGILGRMAARDANKRLRGLKWDLG